MTSTQRQQLLQRLDKIGASPATTEKALALIGLGSVDAELDRLDDYSDLDFFVVVKDGHKAEFAVFELRELEQAAYTTGCIMWKDDAFDEQWRVPKKQPVPWKPESKEWLIGEIVTCLYVGLCRLQRGEQLSAWRFVQGHAITLLLELIEFEVVDPALDVFSKERRFEQRHPEWPAHLSRCLQDYDRVAESAQDMLAYLYENYAVPPKIKRVILKQIDRFH